MLNTVTSIITTLGYPGITGLMFLENIYPPLPSEIIMPLAGFSVAQGELNLFFVILSGTLGSVLGTTIWYYVGHFVGKERIIRWTNRYGKWFTVSPKDVEKADAWFDRNNKLAVFLGRLIPGVRSVISIPAGISGMRLIPFLIFTAFGSLIWTAGLTLLGYFLRQNWELADQFIAPIGVAVILLIIIWYFVRFFREHRRSKGEIK